MPELELLGRAWTVGSDDFVFAGLRGGIGHGVFAIGLPLVFNFDSHECGEDVQWYIRASFVVHTISSLVFGVLAFCSSRGGILEVHKRTLVPVILLLALCASLFVLGLGMWGVLLIEHRHVCDGKPKDERWVVAAAIFQLTMVGLTLCALLLDYSCCANGYSDPSEGEEHLAEYRGLWKGRLQRACCLLNGSEDLYADIAMVLADIFAGLNLVPSDIAAGLVLVQARQVYLIQKAQNEAGLRLTTGYALDHDKIKLSHEARPVPRMIPHEERQLESDVETLSSYSNYFMAAYGWPLHVFASPVSCCCRMSVARCTGMPGSNTNKVVHKDNCCGCNTAAWVAEAGVEKGNLLYIHWEAEIRRPAFFVCADHDKKAVIVGIRGTLSGADVVTDVNAESMPFGEHLQEPNAPKPTAHKGIATAALNIKKILDKDDMLKKILHAHDGYRLVVLGHSLGAGSSALLAVALKEEYPNVLGLSYSVPGGLMNKALSELSRPFVIAMGMGQDCIPRTSIRTVRSVRDQMLEAFMQSKEPKCKVFGCCCCLSAHKQAEQWMELENLLSAPETTSATEPFDAEQSLIGESARLLKQYFRNVAFASINAEPLFPPARYVHVMRFGWEGGTVIWHPMYYPVEQLIDEGIYSSANMFIDHLPNKVRDMFAALRKPKHRKQLAGWGSSCTYRNPLRAIRVEGCIRAHATGDDALTFSAHCAGTRNDS